MNAHMQAQAAMRYRMAHGLWFAAMLSAAREGREFHQPEPKIEDYAKEPE